MSAGMQVHTGHPAAVYDPRWFDEVDFDDIGKVQSSDQVLVQRVFDHYQDALWFNPRAVEFLRSLGIDDPKLIQQWGVGFADRTLGKQLPDGETWEGTRIRGALQRLGLLVTSGGEFFRGALVFPYQGAAGDITAAYGERITPKLRSGTPYHLYWSSTPPAMFFNQQVLGVQDEVILCTNPLEAMILSAAGYPNVVATLGARGFDLEQLEALAGNQVRQVTLTLANMPEGDRVSRLIAQALSAYGIACHRLGLPTGASLTGYVRRYGADAIDALLENRKPCMQSYEGLKGDGVA